MTNLPTHPEVVQHPGPHILDKTIGCFYETKEDFPVVVCREIEANGSLIAIAHRIVARIKPFLVISGPGTLMPSHLSLWRFNFDHICSHIGEKHCCERPRKGVCDIKDT
jgi:hypothetical protein